MKLIIAGGGTGGHLYPGMAVAEELLARAGTHEVLFVGARGGLEEHVLPKHNYRLELLPSMKGGLFGFDLPNKTYRLCKGYMQARKAIIEFDADVVVGLGGYASAIPVLASWGVEVPCLILEQNAIPGRTTRRLAHFADEIGLTFMEAAQYLPRNAVLKNVGNPLRPNLIEEASKSARRNTTFQETIDQPVVLVLGGSQGAVFLNEIIVKVWPRLRTAVPNARILLVSGVADADRARVAFSSAGVRGKVFPYCEHMEHLYTQAHVVLARAGATSISEINAFGLPSILIPYPYAADDHQSANARILRLAGASWSLGQQHLEEDRVAQRLIDVLLQPERRRRMAAASLALAKPEAAANVVDRLEVLAAKYAARRPPAGPAPRPPTRPDAVHSGVMLQTV